MSISLVETDVTDPLPGECWNLNQIAQHNTAEDCYYILYDSVYDFTDYLDRHPGGDTIMVPDCGRDATVSYEAFRRHTIQRLSRQADRLYLIGEACS